MAVLFFYSYIRKVIHHLGLSFDKILKLLQVSINFAISFDTQSLKLLEIKCNFLFSPGGNGLISKTYKHYYFARDFDSCFHIMQTIFTSAWKQTFMIIVLKNISLSKTYFFCHPYNLELLTINTLRSIPTLLYFCHTQKLKRNRTDYEP